MTGWTPPPPPAQRRSRRRVRLSAPQQGTPLGLLLGGISMMWVSEGLDQAFFDEALDAHGIVPRQIDSLYGVILAPFLHAGFPHLMANTVPLLILGALIGFKGYRRLATVTAGVILLGGLALWVVGRDGVHVGASIVVFGYFGYLIAAAVFERKLRSIVLAGIAVLLYGGIIWGALPTTSSVSWEGHLCGLLAGIAMAWWVTRPPSINQSPSQRPRIGGA